MQGVIRMMLLELEKVLLSACLVCSLVTAEVIPFNTDLDSEKPFYVEIAKYAEKGDVPNWSPGNGRNTIDMSGIKLTSLCDGPNNSCKSTIDVLIFSAPALDPSDPWLEEWSSEEKMCCTDATAASNQCFGAELHQLINPPGLLDSFKRTIVLQDGDPVDLEEDTGMAMTISRKGLYVIMIASCDPSSATVKVRGSIENVNPYGYVPAEVFPDMPFYACLTVMYLAFGLYWIVSLCLHGEELIYLQYWISFVLTLGMIETCLLYDYYHTYNEVGHIPTHLLVWSLTFGVSKRAVSRVVVLIVSMGYGVVRQSLGEDMKRVLGLGISYCVLSLIFTLTTSLPSSAKNIGDPGHENLFSLVIMLLAAIDTIFYMWTISSINNLIITLEARKQTMKLQLYKNFRFSLVAALSFAVLWAVYTSILMGTKSNETRWEYRWSIDAISELLYFLIFVAIAVLWAPSRNNQRYVSYVELTPAHDEGDSSTNQDEDIDAEYGGSLDEDRDVFQGGGALDPAMAIMKKS